MHMLPVTVPWDALCISICSHSLSWIKSLFLYWFCVGEMLLSNGWFLLHPRILSVVFGFVCFFSSWKLELILMCIISFVIFPHKLP